MAVFELRTPLSPEDRAEKRKLILRDTVALVTILLITAALAVLTYFLSASFTRHRDVLARRWKANGERAMRLGKPDNAVQALRSALNYAPGRRDIEIELAMALAADNRPLEATAYFNSLLETQPGNGLIHLQLARLAARDGKADEAEEHYQRALDGTWEGDGYVRRREVRLELARYLISQKNFPRAQTELRTAAGNAPKDPDLQLRIAGLLEHAQDPADALAIYRSQTQLRNAPVEAFEGAGRIAYALGHITVAREALLRAIRHKGFSAQPESQRESIRQMYANSNRILDLYPDPDLTVRTRASRIQNNAKIAHARLAACLADPHAAAKLAPLQAQWQQLSPLTLRALERNPQLEQTTMGLVYATEKQTAQVCGAPTGDDAILLKLAQAPQAVQD
jgi:tetratricopeptide (TPR) repeat protein